MDRFLLLSRVALGRSQMEAEFFPTQGEADAKAVSYGPDYSPRVIDLGVSFATGSTTPAPVSKVLRRLTPLRDGERYMIDDHAYSGNEPEFLDSGEALIERLGEMANDRDMGTNNWSCHHDRPTVYIVRGKPLDFTVTHTVTFDN